SSHRLIKPILEEIGFNRLDRAPDIRLLDPSIHPSADIIDLILFVLIYLKCLRIDLSLSDSSGRSFVWSTFYRSEMCSTFEWTVSTSATAIRSIIVVAVKRQLEPTCSIITHTGSQ